MNEMLTSLSTGSESRISAREFLGTNLLSNDCHKVEKNENGKYEVEIVGREGKIFLPEEQGETIVNIDLYRNLSAMSTMAIAYHLSKVSDDMLERLNYKSVKAFATDFCGLATSTVNQYIRIGSLVDYTEEKGYIWKFEWMTGASVTNINQCLSYIEKNGIEKFKIAVENGDINILSSLSRVKKDLASLKKGIIEEGDSNESVEESEAAEATEASEASEASEANEATEKSLQERVLEKCDELSKLIRASQNESAIREAIKLLVKLEKVIPEL